MWPWWAEDTAPSISKWDTMRKFEGKPRYAILQRCQAPAKNVGQSLCPLTMSFSRFVYACSDSFPWEERRGEEDVCCDAGSGTGNVQQYRESQPEAAINQPQQQLLRHHLRQDMALLGKLHVVSWWNAFSSRPMQRLAQVYLLIKQMV
jgi:hypothetical protein